jgi:integrase/recombinase XerD
MNRISTSSMRRLHRFDVLAAWFKEYMVVRNYRPRTIKSYTADLALFRRWLHDNGDIEDIDDITQRTLHDYAAGIYEKQVAASTLHHNLSVLAAFFRALYDKNKLYTDLRACITFPRVPKALPKNILTEEETGRVFAWLEATVGAREIRTFDDAMAARNHALLEVFYSSGLRKAEFIELCLDDVNYDDGLLHVRHGKGGKERVVPLGRKAIAVLRRYVGQARPIIATGEAKEMPYLFLSMMRNKMGENTVLGIVKTAVRAAGVIRPVTVHTLRHCCATHMLNNGADIRYVQEFLGHSCLSSTQIYTHISIGKLKETHRRCHPREHATFLAETESEDAEYG